MARKYDIIERLKAKNERPFVMLDEEHRYSINTSKTTVMAILALAEENNNGTVQDDMKLSDKIIKLALGDRAFDYIETLDLTMEAYSLIINAILAAINGSEIEDIEKQTEKK